MRIIRKRCPRISEPQKAAMVKFLKSHPKLYSGKFDDNFRHEDARVLWQELTRIMHGISGARKTWEQWRKAWHDQRHFTKRREKTNAANENNGEVAGSSGLPKIEPTEPIIEDPIAMDSCDLLDPESLSSSRSSPKEFHFADVKTPENEPEEPEPAAPEVIKPKTQKNLTPIMKLAQDLMNKFNTQAKAEEEYRKTHLDLIREQTEALKSIAKSLEALRK